MRMEDMVIVSVDDHIVETPDIFDKHLPAKWKDQAPKCIRKPSGEFQWEFQGRHTVNFALNAVAGRPKEELGFEPNSFEHIRKGCYDPKARLDDMNVNGIFAGVNFPTFPGFSLELFLGTQDKSLATALIKAYNDWHIDEFCATAPDRFIPMVSLPLYDINESVAELKRTVAKGVRTISFPPMVHNLGLPDIHGAHWEPLWKACAEMSIPISIHVGAGKQTGTEHLTLDSPMGSFLTKVGLASMTVLAEWLWSEQVHKYRNLKIILSEGGVGWIPYILERAEHVNTNHGPWMGHDWHGRSPTQVFRDQFISCFIQDEAGVKCRDIIGLDNITFENDYPHADITWPYTPEQLWNGEFEKGAIGAEAIDKITHKTALKTYRWDAVDRLGREKCNVAAMRELGRAVDLTPISGGGKPPREHPGSVRARDIIKLFPTNDPPGERKTAA
jgi:predicted TIM-barrel fold metal-dependent hydrolase